MLLKEEVQLLRRIPYFAKVDPCRLKLLAFASSRVSYDANQELFHQGDAGDCAYVLLDGSADILMEAPEGEVKIGEVKGDCIVGEVCLLCDGVRTATVRTTTPVEALKICKDAFSKVLIDPGVTREVTRAFAEQLHRTTSELDRTRADQRQLVN